MNKRLQAILDLLQQSGSLTPEEKKSLADAVKESDKEITITEFKLERTEKVKRTTAILLEETIAELEQKRKSVETQNRELEIEAALERVRSRSIAMRQSSELGDLSFELVKQVQALGISTWHCAFNIYDEDQESSTEWGSNANGSYPIYKTPREGIFRRYYDIGQSGETLHVEVIGEDKCADHYAYLCTLPGVGETLVKVRDSGISFPKSQIDHVAYFKYGYLLFITFEPAPEAHDVFKRFAKVFEQTYTRFLDLQKAEAQARESQIQLALERVRARTMAMQKSIELPEAANLLFQQVQTLGMPAWSAGYCIWDEDKQAITLWMSSEGVLQPPFRAPLTEDPSFIHFREAYEQGETFFVDEIGGEELVRHYKYMRTLPVVGEILDSIIEAGHPLPTFQIFHLAYFSQGFLLFITYEPVPEAHDIFKRFAKVFEQTYTRFLDLLKVEAQVKEAQVEAALERVRAKTMAMHKSEQLAEVATVLFEQFNLLGEIPDRVSIGIIKEEAQRIEWWVTNQRGGQLNHAFNSSMHEYTMTAKIFAAWKNGDSSIVIDLTGKELDDWIGYVQETLKLEVDASNIKGRRIHQGAYFSQGILLLTTNTPLGIEVLQLLERFARVFNQTYTRFLDLQKAEAQAREAKIEAGLERVRSRAMAMQTSEELNALIGTVFTELTKLDLVLTRCVIMTYDQKTNDARWWMANSEAPEQPMNFYVQYHEHPPNLAYFSAWRERTVKWIYTLSGKVKKEWDDFIFRETELKLLPDFVIAGMKAPDRVFLNASFYNSGNLTLASLEPLSDEHFDILIRFAKVFDLTYTRFNDLKQAEAQAREAKIEAALERVRSRTMAMQRSEELVDVASILFQQVKALGVPQWNCGLNIWEIGDKEFTFYPGTPDGILSPKPCKIPLTEHPVFISFDESRKRGDEFFVYEKEGEYQAGHYRYMLSLSGVGDLLQSMLDAGFQFPTYQIDHVVNFSHGNLIFITYEHFPEMHDVFKRFGKVFEQTYTRFLDLQKAEAQAREAQIESALEKVRSRSLAMHKSDEVGFVVDELFLRMKDLEIGFDSVNILEFTDDAFQVWAAYKPGKFTVTKIPFSKSDIPYVRSAVEAKNSGLKFFTHQYSFEEKNQFLNYLFDETHFKNLPDERKQFLLACPCYTVSIGFAKTTAIQLQSYSRAAFSESENNILNRFVNVFEQAYTRFLDLQQAEGQAREAQIQLALERVRARTMAMQHSNELRDAASVLFQQVKELGIDAWTCGFSIWNEDRKTPTAWLSRGVIQPPFKTPLTENETLMHFYEAAQRGESLFVEEVGGETLIELYRYLGTLLVSEGKSGEIRKPGYSPPTSQVNHVAYFSYGYLLFITYKQYPEAHDIFKRFAKVFEQTYTRFLDLQKAEAQTREAQIEVSLERVRSKAMAMHKSEDLSAAVAVVFDELDKLDLGMSRCGIGILNKEKRNADVWTTSKSEGQNTVDVSGDESMDIHPLLQKAFEAWVRQEDFTYVLQGEDLADYYRALQHTNFRLPEFEAMVKNAEMLHHFYHVSFEAGALYAFREHPFTDEAKNVMKRFANVFSLTYKRFQDILKAEAQAREAKIEAVLERVRSRTMAMHKSEELTDVAGLLFEQVSALDIKTWTAGFNVWSEDNNSYVDYITSPQGGFIEPYTVYTDRAEALTDISNARKSGVEFDVQYVEGEKIKQLYLALTKLDKEAFEIMLQDGVRFPSHQYEHFVFGSKVSLMFITYEPVPEAHDIFKRLGKVFEQTYTRFLDLRKAEAQARESQIEAALERTRTQSMLMQHSVQLDDTLRVFHEQVLLLGIKSAFSFLWLPDEKNDRHIFWAVWAENSSSEQVKKDSTVFKSKAINYPLDRNEPATAQCLVDWNSDQPVHSYHVRPADVENYFSVWKELLDGVEKLKAEYFQGGLYYVEAFMKYGCFGVMIEGEMPEDEKKTLGRLAIEFERAYTRFLDLQKAEAQAREATIEASLEKVRGKAMAMHNSNDLSVTASMVFTELRKLGINPFRCGVSLQTKESRKNLLYYSIPSAEGDTLSLAGSALLSGHPVLSAIYDNWVRGEDYFPVLKGESLINYYQTLKQVGFDVPVLPSGHEQYGYYLAFSEGVFYGWSEKPYTDDELKILHRFKVIIDLTFRRYMELQKSEENTTEAIRQASLDRVRAEIASMRTTNDLDRITPLIWKELNILSIPFVRCGVFIMDEVQRQMHTFLSTPEGEAIAAFNLPYETPGNVGDILSHWQHKQMYISHWDEMAFSELGELLLQQGAIPSKEVYMSTVPPGGIHLHCLPFMQGMLYVGNTTQLQESDIHLIQSVADAFSTAYARYEDFNKLESAKAQIEKTLTDLKQTQTLLVQSEKMASLGELTAGIAHEIQNPLNFVNNFSEVSNELLEEMKEEIQKGNFDQVQSITNNIKQNLEKILHHGKRADGIVKGMLQHSRSSSGVKEPTDINALADEYLRLAYHGFRAKDKSFNASTITDLDKSIGKINVVPQDIGRVVLNLITNAFYTVTEKQKQTNTEYRPTVHLSTKRHDDCVLISVKDNGNGIPKQIREKIFQPFFTTKPTGQGTGLGLSLSYDIVKAHGGELKVETKESEGSEFVLQLPLS
jgi:signal transduction histidine kinase